MHRHNAQLNCIKEKNYLGFINSFLNTIELCIVPVHPLWAAFLLGQCWQLGKRSTDRAQKPSVSVEKLQQSSEPPFSNGVGPDVRESLQLPKDTGLFSAHRSRSVRFP